MCLNCGFFGDADIQASVNIGIKGLETLGISQSKLLMVNQKVTPKPELTGSKNREKISISSEIEPGNLQQLSLFEWVNGEVIPC